MSNLLSDKKKFSAILMVIFEYFMDIFWENIHKISTLFLGPVFCDELIVTEDSA